MADPTLPTLSLFKTSPPKYKKERVAPTHDTPIQAIPYVSPNQVGKSSVLTETFGADRMREQNLAVKAVKLSTRRAQGELGYTRTLLRQQINKADMILAESSPSRRAYGVDPSLPYVPPVGFADIAFRKEVELEYLRTYYDTLNKNQTLSQRQPLIEAKTNKPPVTNLPPPPPPPPPPVHNNKLSNKGYLGVTLASQKQPSDSGLISKDPYLNDRKSRPSQNPPQNNPKPVEDQSSIINHITPSLLINPLSTVPEDKSVVIEQPKKPNSTATHEVQTEEPQINRSSFVIQKPVKRILDMMDHGNFKKTISNLTKEINSINLNTGEEDLIIDLSDLIMTKDQYIEESKQLLSSLKILSQGNAEALVLRRSGKQTTGVVWPQGT